jgi:hypothetical protein
VTPLSGPRPQRRDHFGPRPEPTAGSADRAALWVLLAFHGVLELALLAAGWSLYKYLPAMQLGAAQKVMFQVGLAAAFVAFGLRGLALWRRLRRTRRR